MCRRSNRSGFFIAAFSALKKAPPVAAMLVDPSPQQPSSRLKVYKNRLTQA